MHRKTWTIFIVVQSAGFILISLANIHAHFERLFLGMLLLLPGSLLAFLLPFWVDNFPGSMSSIALGILIAGVNALLWYMVSKPNQHELMK